MNGNKMKRFIFIFIVISTSLSAQQIRFNSPQLNSQVSTNRIKSFAQDERGFM